MNCSACKKSIESKELMKCRLCVCRFHIQCLNIEKKQFLALTKEYKSTWICPTCSSITRRARSNDNTPVRPSSSVTLADNTMNMSCDLSDSNPPSPVSAPSKGLHVKEEVTMEKISILLDEKLSASLTVFMENFRQAIKEDVKEMVRTEVLAATNTIKQELSVTTDFIFSEQKGLQSDIDKTVTTINALEEENTKLRSDLVQLNTRLAGIEKISRSCNIEVQAVPERRNENVVTLFKKLCEVVKVSVEDGHISACRRVAKHNAASSRPRNIIVTFSSPRVRDIVLSAAQRYNKAHPGRGLVSSDLEISGETSRIFVAEHLSLEQKSLHAATRRAAKERSFKYVWIKHGQIYVRKDDSSGAILIKNTESLNKLH